MGKATFTGWLVLFFFLMEWHGRDQQYAIAKLGLSWYKPLRWALYYLLIMAIYLYAGSQQQFIYFQF